MAAGGSGRGTIEGLSGDARHDDELLLSFADPLEEIKPYLEERDWMNRARPDARSAYRLRHVAKAFQRWRIRASRETLTHRESRVLGALGFCLLSMRMVYYTTRLEGQGESTGAWPQRLRRLNRLFQQPSVRDAFAELYDFPEGDLKLASATIHRLGTTSFILRCDPVGRDANVSALKCLLYPYIGNSDIADATEGYLKEYGQAERRVPMARIYDSGRKWIRMEFIEGGTLAEAVREEDANGARRPSRLRVDVLRRFGLPLLDALAGVPYPHMDLSPSNVMVRDRTPAERADIVLIDFGENYLLTHNVSSGSVSAETARYVAPELLRSRMGREGTGYEDIFSVGQILLDLAGYSSGSGGGYIPNDLFMDAPFLAHLVEDMLDEDPEKRLLLIRSASASSLDQEARSSVYRELSKRLEEGLDAHEVLATVTPTLVDTPGQPTETWWGRARQQVRSWLGSLPTMLKAVSQPLKYAQLARRQTGVASEYRYLLVWLSLSSIGWAVAWGNTIARLRADPAFGMLVPSSKGLYGLVVNRDRLANLVHRYQELRSLPVQRWEDLLATLVFLSVGLVAARYYLEIFSSLTVRRLPRTLETTVVEVLMRLCALWVGPIVLIANLFVGRHWGIFGWVMALIVANNYACWRLADRLVRDGEREFSTMKRSDLRHSIQVYAEWWKLMFAYGVVVTFLGVLVEAGLAHDLVIYSFVLMAVNMLSLYRSNCGKKAPGLRASLSRAYVGGERLHALTRRRAAGTDARQSGAVPAPTPAPALT
jgi:hypothetical protein